MRRIVADAFSYLRSPLYWSLALPPALGLVARSYWTDAMPTEPWVWAISAWMTGAAFLAMWRQRGRRFKSRPLKPPVPPGLGIDGAATCDRRRCHAPATGYAQGGRHFACDDHRDPYPEVPA